MINMMYYPVQIQSLVVDPRFGVEEGRIFARTYPRRRWKRAHPWETMEKGWKGLTILFLQRPGSRTQEREEWSFSPGRSDRRLKPGQPWSRRGDGKRGKRSKSPYLDLIPSVIQHNLLNLFLRALTLDRYLTSIQSYNLQQGSG